MDETERGREGETEKGRRETDREKKEEKQLLGVNKEKTQKETQWRALKKTNCRTTGTPDCDFKDDTKNGVVCAAVQKELLRLCVSESMVFLPLDGGRLLAVSCCEPGGS